MQIYEASFPKSPNDKHNETGRGSDTASCLPGTPGVEMMHLRMLPHDMNIIQRVLERLLVAKRARNNNLQNKP